jgi:hypothetical protein
VRAVWSWQRRRAKQLGAAGRCEGGAVAFTQYFGSALQLTPHLHVLVPEGVWQDRSYEALPPPAEEEVGAILVRVVRALRRDFEKLEVPWPEDGLDALWVAGIQHRLPLGEEPLPKGRRKRLAVVEGFRLQADSAVHAHDRQGLLRLCRYGSRGPIATERLSLRVDGRYEYR